MGDLQECLIVKLHVVHHPMVLNPSSYKYTCRHANIRIRLLLTLPCYAHLFYVLCTQQGLSRAYCVLMLLYSRMKTQTSATSCHAHTWTNHGHIADTDGLMPLFHVMAWGHCLNSTSSLSFLPLIADWPVPAQRQCNPSLLLGTWCSGGVTWDWVEVLGSASLTKTLRQKASFRASLN